MARVYRAPAAARHQVGGLRSAHAERPRFPYSSPQPRTSTGRHTLRRLSPGSPVARPRCSFTSPRLCELGSPLPRRVAPASDGRGNGRHSHHQPVPKRPPGLARAVADLSDDEAGLLKTASRASSPRAGRSHQQRTALEYGKVGRGSPQSMARTQPQPRSGRRTQAAPFGGNPPGGGKMQGLTSPWNGTRRNSTAAGGTCNRGQGTQGSEAGQESTRRWCPSDRPSHRD